MARSNVNGQRRHTGTTGPVLRPLAWSALVTAAAAAAFATPTFATPAYAEPPLPDTVPDAGARPVPAGAVQLPGVGPATAQPAAPAPSLVNGPLAAAAYAKEVEVATLGDQLLLLRQEQTAASERLVAAEARLQEAREALTRAQEAAEAIATDALKEAAALPPGTFGSDLHGLSELSPLHEDAPARDASAAERDLTAARAAEEAASEEVRTLQASAADVETRFRQLQERHRLAEASLLKLRKDHAAQLQLIEREREAMEQRLGANFVGRGNLHGMVAHPNALIAVQYALAQLGDPYQWAAEGPDRFDCSGLMWAAYRAAGFELPRVSRDQFYATRARLVSRYDLLPGDLIFFAAGPGWTSIHHVGMYIGDGRMVHAPRTGDVVKISTVWWSRFYAATRIFGEVPAPSLPPVTSRPPLVTPPSSGVSTPPASTPSPTSPAPSPTGPAPSPTSPAPSPTSPTPSPTTPSPTPSSPTPTPTGTASPEPTASTSPEPTTGTTSEPAPAPSEPSSTTDSTSPMASTEPSTSPLTTVSTLASTGGS
jgi:cell wall-associated NlpC family hydrolase